MAGAANQFGLCGGLRGILGGIGSTLSGLMSSLKLMLDTTALQVAELFGIQGATSSLIASLPQGLASLPPGTVPISGFGALGGLLGIGGGIFAALTSLRR